MILAFSRSNSSGVMTPRSRRSASLASWSAVLVGVPAASVRWPGWLVIHRVTSPDGRRRQRERRSGKRGAQRLQVAPHRSLAALVALRGDLGVRQGGVGAALVPPLLEVGGEMVLAAGARARADDHLAGVAARADWRTVCRVRPSIWEI